MTGPRKTAFLRIRRSAAVVLGAAALLLLSAGSALAVPGPAGRGSAAVAQYGDETPAATTTAPEGTPPATSAPSEPPTLTAPPATTQNGPKSSEVQDRREDPGASRRTPTAATPREVVKRVESGAETGQLPLTGMAIVPVLGVGLLLLLAGVVLRRRAQAIA
jgi:LPXTG-motif cell wall-anchored protein